MDELMAGEDEEGMAMMPMMGPGGDNMKFNIIFTVENQLKCMVKKTTKVKKK